MQALGMLHSFGNDPQVETPPHADHRDHDGRFDWSGRHPADKRLVDF